MNNRIAALALAAASVLATVSAVAPEPLGATETRKVTGYILDSTKPGLKMPREFNLDGGTETGTVASANTSTVAALEEGNPFLHQTTFTITAASVTITDATTAGELAALSADVETFQLQSS